MQWMCGGRGSGHVSLSRLRSGFLYDAALGWTTLGPSKALPGLPRQGRGSRGGLAAPTSPRMCYLVDPASSHMLVSKIKPCMCKYEQIQTVKLRMAH